MKQKNKTVVVLIAAVFVLLNSLNASAKTTVINISNQCAIYYSNTSFYNQTFVGNESFFDQNATESNASQWNTAFGWGNHASVGYLTSETDPFFVSSPAYSIGWLNISYWNVAASNANIHYDVYPVTRTVWQHWSVP